MGVYLEKVLTYFRSEDIFDLMRTDIYEHPELILIAAAIVFIMVLSLWTMLVRLGRKGALALVPVYRFVVLFGEVGLKPWMALFLLVPGVNFIARAIFYVFVTRKFSRSYFLVPCLVAVPIVFLPVVAFGEGESSHIKIERAKEKKGPKEKVDDMERELAEMPAFDEFEPDEEDRAEQQKAKPRQKKRLAMDFVRPRKEKLNAPRPITKPGARKQNRPVVKPVRRKRAVTPRPIAKPVEPEPPKVIAPKADRMPEMGRGAISREIEAQRKKAEVVHTNEYETLLEKQQEAQRRRRSGRS